MAFRHDAFVICMFVLPVAPELAAQAQQDSATVGVNEVVVTAQRRAQSTRDVPLVVARVTEEEVGRFGTHDLQSLQMITSGVTYNGFAAHALPFIRGVGSDLTTVGTEPSVALYVDGVYQPRGNLYLQELGDVESVEILKGPQGTLYGRNATAGAIAVTTKRPEAGFNADAALTAGNGDLFAGKFYVAGGSGRVLASLAGYKRRDDGFVRNLTTGNRVNSRDDWTIRGKVVWEVADSNELTLSGDYSESRGDRGFYVNNYGDDTNTFATLVPGACYSTAPRQVCTDEEARTRGDFNWTSISGGTARWLTRFDGFDFLTVGGFRRILKIASLEVDGSSAPLLWFSNSPMPGEDTRFWSIEPQLISTGEGPVSWLVGALYDDFESEIQLSIDIGPPAGGPLGVRTHAFPTGSSKALYGELGYEFGRDDRWQIIAGIRHTNEKKGVKDADEWVVLGGLQNGVDGPIRRNPDTETTWDKTLGNFSIKYIFSEEVTGYARVAQGFKSGAYSVNNSLLPPVDPEDITSFEAGIKSSLADGRVRLEASGFRYWYKDLQVQALDCCGVRLQNAAEAQVYGFELALQTRPLRGFDLQASLTLLETEYDSFPNASVYIPCPEIGISIPMNCTPGSGPAVGIPAPDLAGKRLTRAPKLSSNLAAAYALPVRYGVWELAGAIAYSSKFYYDPNNRTAQPAYTVVNLSFGFRSADDSWYARAWSNNLTDEDYTSQVSSTGFGDFALWADPRTYGITVGINL